MSLDVSLVSDNVQNFPKIFVRESGRLVSISREEWNMRNPGMEPVTVEFPGECNELYSANITHNLSRMADEAGIYKHLWRPDEIGISKANQLIDPLKQGLALLESDPERFEAFNPSNGWGDYNALVAFVREYLKACKLYPNANIEVSR